MGNSRRTLDNGGGGYDSESRPEQLMDKMVELMNELNRQFGEF